METRRINIKIAGRAYPLNVPVDEEETLRKVGNEIEMMIKEFEKNFDVKDKQDVLAMCALKLGTNAQVYAQKHQQSIQSINKRLKDCSQLLDDA
ncbi:MAG: cell division protein ZapA [Flavobacteriales bacterium]|nr:MAG: cell division protein ZapA [Flavobacteriales bacterium]